MFLQFFPEVSEETISRELFFELNRTPLIRGFPTVFHFENTNESKILMVQYPSKLAELIYINLQIFDTDKLNAVIVEDDRGFIHVFFGLNNKPIEIPEVIHAEVAGMC